MSKIEQQGLSLRSHQKIKKIKLYKTIACKTLIRQQKTVISENLETKEVNPATTWLIALRQFPGCSAGGRKPGKDYWTL